MQINVGPFMEDEHLKHKNKKIKNKWMHCTKMYLIKYIRQIHITGDMGHRFIYTEIISITT